MTPRPRARWLPVLLVSAGAACGRAPSPAGPEASSVASLPGAAGSASALAAPATSSSVSLEAALARRRSIRTYTTQAIGWDLLGQLLWSAQGTTGAGARAAPSAGALYPLEVFVVRADGLFAYDQASHAVRLVKSGDLRAALAEAALGQAPVSAAPVVVVFGAVLARTAKKYGQRAERFAAMEAGHAGQNLLLQATALGLGAVPIGGFEDDKVRAVLGLPADVTPLYLIPVGYPAP